MATKKTISVFTYDLNKDKYNEIYKLSILVRQVKNKVSQYVFNNLLYEVITGIISNRNLYKHVTHLQPRHIDASTFQLLCSDVYTMYNICAEQYLKYTVSKSTYDKYKDLIKIIKFIIVTANKNMSYNEYKKKLSISKHNYVIKTVLPRLTESLYNYAIKQYDLMQYNIIYKSKAIKFKNLGFNYKNIITYSKGTMFQPSTNKHTNGIIMLKFKGHGYLYLPFKYNKSYHKNLFKINGYKNKIKVKDDNNNVINEIITQRRYIVNITPLDNKQIKFSICVDDNTPNPVFTDITNTNTVGIDINLKHNIVMFSDGKTIKANNKQLKQAVRLQKRLKKVQQTKAKQGKTKEKYGKKYKKRIEKDNRRNKYYNDYVGYQVKQHCIDKYTNIVMEDLHLQGKIKGLDKQSKLKYNQLIRTLHINDLKNVIPRICNKQNINVHKVNPEYTSQTCPLCGNIDENNRKIQETFYCTKCHYTNNADYNSANNIKNRITNDYLRDNLEKYQDNHYVSIFKKHYPSNKDLYVKIYNDLHTNLRESYI